MSFRRSDIIHDSLALWQKQSTSQENETYTFHTSNQKRDPSLQGHLIKLERHGEH